MLLTPAALTLHRQPNKPSLPDAYNFLGWNLIGLTLKAIILSLILSLLISLINLPANLAQATDLTCQPALSLYGKPKYAANFKHLDYVNPQAPQGGSLMQAALGTFDSLNPFIIQGTPATGLSNIYDSLTYHSADEPFTEYGLLAECMRLAADGSFIEFKLRPQARFHDGTPVTAADVAFTFELLREQGRPFYRAYYADISSIQVLNKQQVRFNLASSDNRELPLIIGQVPILPQHYWAERDFKRPSLDVPLGSGPYTIAEVDSGRRIVYQKVADYWGKDLPINLGRHNIHNLVFDYYRDATVALEAFKAGRLNLRLENIARNWATGYSGPALQSGALVLESIAHKNSSGMQGYFMNSRRPVFQDPQVRQALTLLFDFEWSNQQLFHNAYTRTTSYFSNSELASSGLPTGQELEILQAFAHQLPPEVFTQEYRLPITDASGNMRPQMRQALQLLQQAGWQLEGRRLVNSQGQQLRFEMLLYDTSFERVALPWRQNLERIGIQMDIRVVDVTQYLNRLREFDYDLIVASLGQSLSPGNEQREYFHSEFANSPDGRNISGIADPSVDALIEQLIRAPDRDTLIATTRALDRVLLWGHYVIPHWHLNEYRLARYNNVHLPQVRPAYALPLDTFWVE